VSDDTPPSFDADAVIDAMAPLLGLTIAEAYRPGIAANLAITAKLAAMVMSFPLEEREEPAAVFVA